MTSLAEITTAQEQTAAAFTRIVKKGRLSFSGVYTVEDSLMRLEIGGALGCNELLRICKLLEVTNRAKAYGRHETVDEEQDCLDVYFRSAGTTVDPCRRDPPLHYSEEEISDDASSTLKHIRRAMKQTNQKIHTQLTTLVSSASNQDKLQDAIVTMRNGRYCIPVKQEYRSSFQGMIHDQSASGNTLFIEPMSVVTIK